MTKDVDPEARHVKAYEFLDKRLKMMARGAGRQYTRLKNGETVAVIRVKPEIWEPLQEWEQIEAKQLREHGGRPTDHVMYRGVRVEPR